MGIIEGKITYFLPSTIIKNSLLNLSGLLIVGIGVLLPPVPWIIMVPAFKILSIIVCEKFDFLIYSCTIFCFLLIKIYKILPIGPKINITINQTILFVPSLNSLFSASINVYNQRIPNPTKKIKLKIKTISM